MVIRIALAAVMAAFSSVAIAQQMADVGAQKAALARFDRFDGVWRGPATVNLPGSEARTLIQTERVGPAIGGTIKLMEGHSYTPEGADANFNALGIVSFDDQSKAYTFRAYAQGRAGSFDMKVTETGYEWSPRRGRT